jgi:hypothetical protein
MNVIQSYSLSVSCDFSHNFSHRIKMLIYNLTKININLNINIGVINISESGFKQHIKTIWKRNYETMSFLGEFNIFEYCKFSEEAAQCGFILMKKRRKQQRPRDGAGSWPSARPGVP